MQARATAVASLVRWGSSWTDDLASERGGNCELTRPDETVVVDGVTILGPTNLPATVPYHASQMYSKNLATFLLHLTDEGRVNIDMNDEITRGTLLAKGGEVASPPVREILGLEPLPTPDESPST